MGALGVAPGASWAVPGCPPPSPTARMTRWACQGTGCPNPTRRFSWPLLGALGLLLEAPGLLLAAPSHVGQDTQIQPGAPPGHSWVLLSCSWSFLACSWLPLAMLARMPKVSQELFLATPGCSWVAPGASWLLLAAFSHVGPNPARSFSWPFLGVGCSWNFPGPVMPCALCASMQRSCYPCVPNWDKNVMGGMGGKPRVSQKTLNPKRE